MSDRLAITAHGLTKQYKNVTAVNNLDLDIPCGAIYGFLGPNGAGKTTTIRMLLGLVKPTSGNATVLGYDIERERPAIASKVGAIVETPAFYNYLSGIENLMVMARSSNINVSTASINQLLSRVGLSGRGKDRVKTYSLGMKQRLGIAATLISNPQILFLDEPTNGLDPAGTVEMRELIAQLGAEGRTIFLSSHLLNEVEQVCTDVVIIQQGIKKLQARIGDLLALSAGFMIKAAPLERAVKLLYSYSKFTVTSHEDWISINASTDDIPSLVRALVQNGIDIYQIQEQRQSLEKLFLELTAETKPCDIEKQVA
ncbi:MAG: ABC transporter ATP-binding protein [Acidobacteriota bacterium]